MHCWPVILAIALASCSREPAAPVATVAATPAPVVSAVSAAGLSDDDWRARLTPLAFAVLRRKATELAFTGKYDKHFEPGVYHCAGCGDLLFSSNAKFDSRTGWPSFFQPAAAGSVTTKMDGDREEVLCSRCGGHLGHVFPDGPEPTRLRYCINSAAVRFDAGRIE